MAEFSQISRMRLSSCHQDLQTVCHYAIQIIDFSIVYGKRTAEQQFKLFKKGRKLVGGTWIIIDDGKVVTHKDGYEKKSRHQKGDAIDIIPYPDKWSSERRFFELAGVIKATAYLLKKYNDIENDIEWGFDLWNWDLAHFQLWQKD